MATVTLSATNGGGTGTLVLTIDLQSDSDRDGIPNSWETANGLNPNSAADALLDSDGDGNSNRSEFLAGTDPQDPRSFFKVVAFIETGAPDSYTLLWDSVPGRRYRITRSNDLIAWTKMEGGDIVATGTTTEVAIESSGEAKELYRVETGLDY